ncbi:MAG: hypothetical protein LBU96_09175 [Yokenella regensburgei]|jgi:hypothetical protein|uniref:Multiple antibiotic resistance protein MarB n=1 Tax=Yokenella regensburgei TaxID=158877 RepID=A0AB38FQJ7_9ENTR|nr:hypothetical protein [Yokenella regensburgei]EHM47899.1 hypothetical protein HMPREF0880_02712 [Yokenella regensburgei ATCC 43003]KFD19357.1 hypothetical protein GYRE_04561 [Yokenella regensburgei ATCC 49455]MDQ4431491.1 hypothetical protein [Yokenella regensburgei]MDR3104606.1 hypothetical protein [Yokenella regensburgei]RKR65296.1 hypothetical protein C7387_2023 [Yokenella regensburgei]
MKIVTAVSIALLLSSTSALAFQEKPVQEVAAQSSQKNTPALSQFSDDDNDGAIAQAYGPAAFSGTSVSSTVYPMPVPHSQR